MNFNINNNYNPLQCPICYDYRYLTFHVQKFEISDKLITLTIPNYECKNCKIFTTIFIDQEPIFDNHDKALELYHRLLYERTKYLKENENLTLSFQNKKFDNFTDIDFKYDSADYYLIPGLFRPWDDGALCPVFFNKEALLFYNNNPEYRIIFSSFSRLQILDNKNEPIIPHGFGINRYGKIICWLTDLYKEFIKPINEKHRGQFLLFNENSDHDIVSDYYFNQIETNFTESDNELKIFELRNEFDEKFLELNGYKLTNIPINDYISEYKHPILNEIDQINNSYIKLNLLLVESLNVDTLKKLILEFGITKDKIKGLKGLKLFEIFINNVIKQEKANLLVSPLYVLYDLRVLASHIHDSDYLKKMNFCKSRLNLLENSSEYEVYKSLINHLIKMYRILNDVINYNKLDDSDLEAN